MPDPKDELVEEFRSEIHALRAELFPHKLVALTRQLLQNPAFNRTELGLRIANMADGYESETKMICHEI